MRCLVGITLVILIDLVENARAQEQPRCGERLKGPVGTITTPNFPNPFPVPIKCRWIIEHSIVNGTISVYFTQQYITSGLTFTEYMYYDETYKLGERRALTVTEENITKIKWLQVQSPVLVVELSLDRLEGTQLRALGLLAVFGLNVTYAVQAPGDPGPTSCSAIECRLLGHCYASHSYKDFFCSCFEGYSGEDCGVGPLCPKHSNMCHNGGTCRQIGPAAVSCICAPGYTGDLCESQIATPECGIEECSEGCKEGTVCDCTPRDTDFSAARFETRLQIVDNTSADISQDIMKHMSNYLRLSNVTFEEIEILNISVPDLSGVRSVWLRVWGPRREAGALRAALARLPARARDRLRLLPATLDFDMHPALSLHALVVNQRTEVWEGSEFILSCMAYGSSNIAFTWYKDGVKVNFNGTTRDIWTRVAAEDALGRRMSVLGVTEARRLDGGRWSCAASDAGRRQCSALRLTILTPPDIRLLPTTLTVDKGDNVSITCLAGAGRMHGALGFSWARERTLLALAPGREVWEDLYPAGSVLKLYNVQKSGEFRCQVSSVAGTNAKGVTMWALGPHDAACESGASHGVRWPRTAPGAHAAAPCPPGDTGETTRFCEPKTIQHGVKWTLPDFSGCVSDSLRDIYEQFTRISYGYSWSNVSYVARQYGAVLRALPARPGAGASPLRHARAMLTYLRSAAGTQQDRNDAAEPLLVIYDMLLEHPDAFLDEEKIYELQSAIVDTALMRDMDLHYHSFSVTTKRVREDNAHFHFLLEPAAGDWLLSSVGVELVKRSANASVVAVQYHDLVSRLPSLRRAIEFKGGRELEYRPSSAHVQLATGGAGPAAPHTVTLLFVHAKNYTALASKLACAVRTVTEPRVWNTAACEARVPEPSHVACRCRGLGTYALLTVASSTLTEAEKDLRGVVKITVGLGGAMCLVSAVLQLLSLIPTRKSQLPVLLKAVTAGTHSAAVISLLDCDTRQEEACGTALGWVCAACWCAGCAALCAQPLLLQAELAGRAQAASSVGLLAGVCTLVCLTARLWGGSPLLLGSGAQAVCAAGCALLTALGVALALCAALRLRTITNKVPAERRTYLKERGRVVSQTLALVATTTAVQAAGVAYAQPGSRRLPHVAALSAAALANGVAMLICYILQDEECLRSARRLLTTDWGNSPVETSLSLYIKQGREVESRAACDSPETSYWRAPALESPAHMHRRQSTDTRADIVRCVEYKEALSPHRTDVAVCDLIPHARQYRVCLERGPPRDFPNPQVLQAPQLEVFPPPQVLRPPQLEVFPPSQVLAPPQLEVFSPQTSKDLTPLTPTVNFAPYKDLAESCAICVQSNPDISKMTSFPIKSCLKKTKTQEFASSVSLPSADLKDEKPKSDIEDVNREWNRAYDSDRTGQDTDKVLNKISHDLDFLLNRTKENAEN